MVKIIKAGKFLHNRAVFCHTLFGTDNAFVKFSIKQVHHAKSFANNPALN